MALKAVIIDVLFLVFIPCNGTDGIFLVYILWDVTPVLCYFSPNLSFRMDFFQKKYPVEQAQQSCHPGSAC